MCKTKSTVKIVLTVLAVLCVVAGVAILVCKYVLPRFESDFLDDIDDVSFEDEDEDDVFDDLILED